MISGMAVAQHGMQYVVTRIQPGPDSEDVKAHGISSDLRSGLPGRTCPVMILEGSFAPIWRDLRGR